MADGPWGLNGDLWLRAGQASTALSMLRLSPGGTPVSGELDLRAAITKKDSKFQVANVALQIGGETISGNATVDIAGRSNNSLSHATSSPLGLKTGPVSPHAMSATSPGSSSPKPTAADAVGHAGDDAALD